jgi:hypothetical protein
MSEERLMFLRVTLTKPTRRRYINVRVGMQERMNRSFDSPMLLLKFLLEDFSYLSSNSKDLRR